VAHTPAGDGSWASVPLRSPGGFIGTISCWRGPGRPRFQGRDLLLLEDLARRAGVALENRRLFHELREADRAKDEFLAMLAHELRNPLAPILLASQLLGVQTTAGVPTPKPTNVTRAREVIERQLKHLVRIVDDLLDVSRIVRGKVRIESEALELRELLDEALGDLAPTIANAGLTLEKTMPAEPIHVRGDRTRLTQVVGNLVSNAVKFTDRNGRVAVSLAVEGGHAVLAVQDTGMGLTPDVLRRVFVPFVQADRSLDRSRGGLGLGLAIVRGIVQLHGGGVEAESAGPGKGARFTVTLPRVQPATTSEASASAPGLGAGPPLRVLVVDDNLDVATTLRDLLAANGHEVEVAHDGPAALEKARGFRPEVILCDLGLPGMTGFELATRLRREPSGARSRIVAISGYGRESDRARAREVGFDEHLTKPVSEHTLARALRGAPVAS
jgi:signal transduction histidine kinase